MDVVSIDLVNEYAQSGAVCRRSLNTQGALQGVNVLAVVLQSDPAVTVLREGPRNLDSVISGSLASPKPPAGGEPEE